MGSTVGWNLGAYLFKKRRNRDVDTLSHHDCGDIVTRCLKLLPLMGLRTLGLRRAMNPSFWPLSDNLSQQGNSQPWIQPNPPPPLLGPQESSCTPQPHPILQDVILNSRKSGDLPMNTEQTKGLAFLNAALWGVATGPASSSQFLHRLRCPFL